MKIDQDILDKYRKKSNFQAKQKAQPTEAPPYLSGMPGMPAAASFASRVPEKPEFLGGYLQGAGENALAIPNLVAKPFGLNVGMPQIGDQKSAMHTAGRAAGAIFSPMPGLRMIGQRIQGLASGAGIGSNLLKSMLSGTGQGAAATAGYGLTKNPGENLNTGDTALGAVVGGTLPGAFGLAKKAIGAIPNKYLSVLQEKAAAGEIRTPEEAQKMLSYLQKNEGKESQIDIGTLTGHEPSKSFYSDMLGMIPFSGVRKAEQGIKKEAYAAEKAVEKELGMGRKSEKVPFEIEKRVISAYENRKKEAEKAFSGIKKAGEKNNVMPQINNLIEKLKEKSGQSSDVLAGIIDSVGGKKVFDTLMKNNPSEVKSAIKAAEKLKEKGTLNKSKYKSTLKELQPGENSFSVLLDKYSDFRRKQRSMAKTNGTESHFYGELANAIEKDINSALSKQGLSGIAKDWSKAKEFYKKNVVPYFDNSIQKIIRNKMTESKIAPVVFRKENEQIARDIGKRGRKFIAHEALIEKGASLESKYKKVGGKEEAAEKLRLLTAPQRERVEKAIGLKQLTAEQKKSLAEKLSKKAIGGTLGALGPVAGGYGISHGLGGSMLANLAGSLGAGAGIGASRLTAKTMRSPAFRKAFLEGKGKIDIDELLKDILSEKTQKGIKAIKRRPNIPGYAISQRNEREE